IFERQPISRATQTNWSAVAPPFMAGAAVNFGPNFSLEVTDMLSGSNSREPFVTRRIGVLLGLMVCLMVYNGVSVQGQTIFGRISGTVKDGNGSAVPNASITITNAATNLVRNVVSDEDGFYTATNLPVGTYTILVTRDGFKRAQQA